MGTSFSKKITFTSPISNLDKILESVFYELGWRYIKTGSNNYIANINMGLKTWGEDFYVSINSENEIFVKSKLKFGLVDWGKNKSNVSLFENKLNEIIQKNKEFISNQSKQIQNPKIDNQIFINNLIHLKKLLVTNKITKEEFNSRKKQLISDLNNSVIIQNKEDFLLSLISLKDNDIISQEDIESIKEIIK